VATFRAHHAEANGEDESEGVMRDGMIVRDNVYGTLRDDAWRRDFTVNALYFDPQDNKLVDYTGGFEDIKDRVLRVIGDPEQRFLEDPVRMLRAVRFAAKLDFQMHATTQAPLEALASRLSAVPAARLFEEVLKLYLGGHAESTFELLQMHHLFEPLFPYSYEQLRGGNKLFASMITLALRNTDRRIAVGKPVTPGFLFAVMLWQPMLALAKKNMDKGMRSAQAHQSASSEVIARQAACVSLPKRFAIQAREIWQLQPRLLNRRGRRVFRVLEHPRFRAAYDFLLLRAEAGEEGLQAVGDWWTRFQDESESEQEAMVNVLQPPPKRRRRRKRNNTA
jgi:poly(A) polymerase